MPTTPDANAAVAARPGPFADDDLASLPELTYYRGRVALAAILRAMNIGPGDDVATQAFTCVAVPEAITAVGARPVYIDIEAGGFNLDPADLRRKLTSRVRAIVVQHTFGIPANLQAIGQVAAEHGLPLIEDCCHTLDSTYQGGRVGTFGAAAFYSFEWGKPLVVGVGGAAWTGDSSLRRRLRETAAELETPGAVSQARLELQYGVHHLLYRPQLYWPLRSLFHRLARLGLAHGNYNRWSLERPASDFRQGMSPRGRRRLTRKLLHARRAYAAHSRRLVSHLQAGLEGTAVGLPQVPPGSGTVFARFPLRVGDKPRLVRLAREANVELAEWYSTPIHPIPVPHCEEVGLIPESCPQALQRTGEIVSLPLHARVSESYVQRVIEFLQRVA